ncbi:hypothetical protein B0H16DRAFT_1876889 [Mycena metata]|uniref:Uncharacterized protein n=1 Tax=Mycena metata TaxID=1033252 RepID=A0AAD7P1Z8_9AGAR|nr:hypothetical protein B0H16DRAFT_1876889 [Mycena metata]
MPLGPAEIAHGPMFLGFMFSAILYGVMILQVHVYFTNNAKRFTFRGAAPPDQALPKDSKESSDILTQLFDLAKTSNTSNRRGIFVQAAPQSKIHLRFSHQFFEKRKHGEEDDPAVPATFKLDRWPVASDAAKQAIEEMKTTHRVNHLEAFDADETLLIPGAYEEKLRGSLATVRFTLSHHYIRKDDADSFTANIDHIRILNPPTPATPTKKRRAFTDVDNVTGDISPKRTRVVA